MEVEEANTQEDGENPQGTPTELECDKDKFQYIVGDMIAVSFDDGFYIGELIEMMPDTTLKVSFM